MPSPSIPTGGPHLSNFPTPRPTQLWKILALALLVVTCVRWAALHYKRKKSRLSPPIRVVLSGNSESWKSSRGLGSSHYRSETWQSPPSFIPAHPWTRLPQPLPGPYDPRLYPLPTLRRHSHPNSFPTVPEETHTISYTRRISTNSIPARQSTLCGTLTTKSNGSTGWRRNQWVVEGG